jgi:two-component system sensor histidine kinase AlgZ
VDTAPEDCLVPLLILQPLLENAFRHGVEPEPEGGEVWVDIARRGPRLMIEVRNSLGPHAGGTGGNGMALANIGERLQLHFDAEARLQIFARQGQFVARVELPVRRGGGAA